MTTVGSTSNIIVVGDIHGDWRHLNGLIAKKQPDIILQCGDFGWWPRDRKKRKLYKDDEGYWRLQRYWDSYGIKAGNTKVYWAPGNHEDWDNLCYFFNNETIPNVYLMRFGDTLTLPDGRIVLFCGGARSTDKHLRTEGFDWFPQEEIHPRDIDKLPDIPKVDIVISHTCPEEVLVQMHTKGYIYYDPYHPQHRDSSRQALSYVMDRYRPDLWYFGHYHMSKEGKWKDMYWFALSMPRKTGWWRYLK